MNIWNWKIKIARILVFFFLSSRCIEHRIRGRKRKRKKAVYGTLIEPCKRNKGQVDGCWIAATVAAAAAAVARNILPHWKSNCVQNEYENENVRKENQNGVGSVLHSVQAHTYARTLYTYPLKSIKKDLISGKFMCILPFWNDLHRKSQLVRLSACLPAYLPNRLLVRSFARHNIGMALQSVQCVWCHSLLSIWIFTEFHIA